MLENLPLARSLRPPGDRDTAGRQTDAVRRILRAHPGAACLDVTAGGVQVRRAPAGTGEDVTLALRPVSEVLDAHPESVGWLLGEERQPLDHGLVYLGRAEGRPWFALLDLREHEDEGAPGAGRYRANLRDVAAILPDAQVDMATAAQSLVHWHTHRRFCGRCAAPLHVTHGGWQRICPRDGVPFFPRIDPAVIMMITDARDRVLLGRAAHFPPTRYSCLAGFVEAGESLENAVRREVAEESGVVVGEVDYLGSQPWPFPRSLMLAFHGKTLEEDPLVVPDGDEMVDARFFSKAELTAACARGTVTLPGGGSIARAMLTQWYGGPLPS